MKVLRWALAVATVLAAAAALVAWLNVRGEVDETADETAGETAGETADVADRTTDHSHTASLIQRGAYLALAGNCMPCHTERGGRPYAGGRGIETPFGTVLSSNLTPDTATGIGRWTRADFWRALHHGRSRDGRLLYPVFPYPNYTQVTRGDADAILAYLRSLPAVSQVNKPHALRFPYNSQAALAVWRALFFKAAVFEPDSQQSAAWNRGAYLVRGLGHCEACHAPRNSLGATTGSVELSGGLVAQQRWYAPSLAASQEAGVADWGTQDIVALLKTGQSPRTTGLVTVMGPMAEVVFRSTQHLADADLQAIATFLQQLPQVPTMPTVPATAQAAADPATLARGATVYADHCSSCHGEQGQGGGTAYPSYPPLAGNRAVVMASSANVVRVVLVGGYLPATAGNPQPYGMPPFGPLLSDAQIADVATYIRQSWGHSATPVSQLDVLRSR